MIASFLSQHRGTTALQVPGLTQPPPLIPLVEALRHLDRLQQDGKLYGIVGGDAHVTRLYSMSELLAALLDRYRPPLAVNIGDFVNGSRIDCTDKRTIPIWKMVHRYAQEEGLRMLHVAGNHDTHLPAFLEALGTIEHGTAYGEHEPAVHQIGTKRFAFLHGHQFDSRPKGKQTLKSLFGGEKVSIRKLFRLDDKYQLHVRNVRAWRDWLDLSLAVTQGSYALAQEAGYQVVVTGHTHLPVHVFWNGVEVINVGSFTSPHPSIAVLETNGDVHLLVLSDIDNWEQLL